MKLKPKSTTLNPKALLYKRFIGLEKSVGLQTIYKTTSDNRFWTFDHLTLTFSNIDSSVVPQGATLVLVANATTILQYQGTYFRYTGTEWQTLTDLQGLGITLLNASFNNIAKYQTNKYYYVGSFDYMIKGSIEGTTAQYIKGNIIPLTAFNIKYFDDSINLSPDDLVVIDKRLFSVESPETVIKQQPRPYKVYFATLNNIL
jgi:hypothetical protein